MTKIAFISSNATHAEGAAYSSSSNRQVARPDKAVVTSLQSNFDILCESVAWENFNFANTDTFDAIVLRSLWNYHLSNRQHHEFKTFIEQAAHSAIPTLNDPKILRWNLQKDYLFELQEKGIHTIDSAIIRKGEIIDFIHFVKVKGWSDAVLKPTVGGDGFNSWRLSDKLTRLAEEDIQNEFEDSISQNDFILQRFHPEIQTEGEYSLAFFGGEYSDCIHKMPGEGEWLSNQNRGGHISFGNPPRFVIDEGYRILDEAQKICGVPFLYARIDGLIVGDDVKKFIVMEVEAIDPSFYIHTLQDQDPQRAQKMADSFASAIADSIRNP